MSATPIRVEERSTSGVQARSASSGWIVLAVLGLAGFSALTVALGLGVVFPFDRPLVDFAHQFAGPAIIWQVVSESANIPLIVLGVGFVLWLLFQHRYREAFVVILVLVAVTAGSEGVKELTARQRPSGNGNGIPGVVYSYPSGHILECLTILGMLVLRFWRVSVHRLVASLLVIFAFIEVALVGVARVALEAHYPTDELGGILGGLTALALYAWFTRPGGWADHPPLAVPTR